MNVTLTPEVRAVLERSTITPTSVILPHQLDRKLYEAVNQVLDFAGGKWNRFAGAHLFATDPRAKLGLTLATGIAVDEQKQFQFFPTPPALAAQVAELADVAGQLVLEPSAGQGALVKACLAAGALAVHCVELNPEHHLALEQLSPKVLIGDFLEHLPHPSDPSDPSEPSAAGLYPRIVMNSPFAGPAGRDQDIAHVEHALKWLAPGGVLVAIMLDNIGRPKFQALTGRLDELAITSESADAIYRFVRVPANTFADTAVRTVILQIKLPGAKESSSPKKSRARAKAKLSTPSTPSISSMSPAIATAPAVALPQPATINTPSSPMKLTIPRSDLLTALKTVHLAGLLSSARPANLLLQAEISGNGLPGRLILTHCDGSARASRAADAVAQDSDAPDLTIRVETPANVATAGSIVVSDRLLEDIALRLTGPDIVLRLPPAPCLPWLQIESDSAKFAIPTLDDTDFPPTDARDLFEDFAIGEATLRALLERTAAAASRDPARAGLNGIRIELGTDLISPSVRPQILAAACDGRRLALMTAETLSDDKMAFTLPNRAVTELLRLLDPWNQDCLVRVAVGKTTAQFTLPSRGSTGDTQITTKLVTAEFPNFRQIIPHDGAKPESGPVAQIPRLALLEAVELVALVADGIHLDFSSHLRIHSAHAGGPDTVSAQGDASTVLLCPITRSLTIRLSAAFLADALRAPRSDVLEFHTNEQGTIALLKSPTEQWLAVIAAMAPSGSARASRAAADAPSAAPGAPSPEDQSAPQ